MTECTCATFSWVPAFADETNLGQAPAYNLDPYDPNSSSDNWFSSIYFDEELANPTISYRYCDLPKTVSSPDVTCTLGAEPLCSDWITKQIPDETNFRIFRNIIDSIDAIGAAGTSYDEEMYDTEWDESCKPVSGAPGLGGCPALPTGATEKSTFVFAYSKAGTVCFNYSRIGCGGAITCPKLLEERGCFSYSDGATNFGDKDAADCFSLENDDETHLLVFYRFEDIDVTYVEMKFNPKEDEENNKNNSSSGHRVFLQDYYSNTPMTWWAASLLGTTIGMTACLLN